MKLRKMFGRRDDGDDAVEDEPAGAVTEGLDEDEPAEDPGAGADEPGAADEGGAAGPSDGPEDEDSPADQDGAADGDDDEGGDDEDDADAVDSGLIEFELPEFGGRERQLLDAELAAHRVRRAWEASTLVVSARDADVVDDLIDLIEERVALDLPPDAEPVIYEVADWPEGLEDRFLDSLIEERIPHMRGYREITVSVDDEERVDALVEEVTAAWEDEQVPEDELDEPDAQEVLSELFVSADRLLHGPSDKGAVVRFDDAAAVAESMRVPFGFDEADWTAIVEQVSALHDLLGEAGSTDEEIVEAATELRSRLRPLV